MNTIETDKAISSLRPIARTALELGQKGTAQYVAHLANHSDHKLSLLIAMGREALRDATGEAPPNGALNWGGL